MRSIKEDLVLRRLDGAPSNPARCTKGKRCGDRCIPRDQECHKGLGSRPLKNLEQRWNKLSALEKTAVAGTTGAVLVGGGAISTIARPIARQVTEELVGAVKKYKQPLYENAKNVAGEAAAGATERTAKMYKQNQAVVQENIRDLYEKSLLDPTQDRLRQVGKNLGRDIVEGAVTAPVEMTKEAVARGVSRDKAAKRRLYRKLVEMEPEWARQARIARRAQYRKPPRATKTDSYMETDAMPKQQLQCPSGYKVCSRRCVPEKTDCRAANFRRAAVRTVAAAGVLGGVGYAAARNPYVRAVANQAVQNFKAGADERMFYSKLGVNKNSSKSEVKKAYYNWAKQNHPDVGGDTNVMQRMNRIWEGVKNRRDNASIWAEGF